MRRLRLWPNCSLRLRAGSGSMRPTVRAMRPGFGGCWIWRGPRAGAVLLVGRTPPSRWPVHVADLKSRLQALPVAQLGEPDEFLIEAVLRRICREHFIELSQDGARYLAQRLPRTYAAAQAVAAVLDAHVRRAARPVTAMEAKRALRLAQEQGLLASESSENT